MLMMYIHITILSYFVTDTQNCQVLWGKEKYEIVCKKNWKISFL